MMLCVGLFVVVGKSWYILCIVNDWILMWQFGGDDFEMKNFCFFYCGGGFVCWLCVCVVDCVVLWFDGFEFFDLLDLC